MHLLVLLQLLTAASAFRLHLTLRPQERLPDDLCQRGATVVVLGANNMPNVPPCCTSFHKLYVHRNLIQQLPEDWLQSCPHLEELSVSQNALRQLPDNLLRTASSLRRLQVARNHVDNLPPGLLRSATSLQELDLSQNQLTQLPATLLETTTQLTELYLQGNALVSIPDQLLATCSKLQHLWLWGNRLVRLSATLLAAAPRLRSLRLDHNEIADVDSGAFQNNQGLQRVDLSNNRLTSLPSGLFANVMSLRYLVLKDNRLRVAPDAASLPKHQISLDLRDNDLQTVEDFSVFGSSRVWLDGNKWRCGCSLAPVLREATSVRQFRWFQQRLTCYGEDSYRRSFSEEDISQCQKSIVDSGGSIAATDVPGPVITHFDESTGETVARTATSSSAAWGPENNKSHTSWMGNAVTDTLMDPSPENSTTEIRSVETGGPNSSNPKTSSSRVGTPETGAPVNYSPEINTSKTGITRETYNRETTPELSNPQSDSFQTLETDTSEMNITETVSSVVSTIESTSLETTSPETGDSNSLSPVVSSIESYELQDADHEVDLSFFGSGMIASSTVNNNRVTANIAASSPVANTSDVDTPETGSPKSDINETSDFKTTSTTVLYDDEGSGMPDYSQLDIH